MDNKSIKTAGFIFARGGSKGVKNKNIRSVAGKPLIGYAIETALQSVLIDQVIVSTDDERIKQTALEFGAQVPFMRPSELASDTSPEWLSWQHAVQTMKDTGNEFDIFVSIPTTSPLRIVQDVDQCIKTLMNDVKADGVISVCKASRHPSFNMVLRDDQGYADIAMPYDQEIFRRQDVPDMYDITTVAYAARSEFILSASSLFEGRIKAVEVPRERSLDIDTEFDLKLAELILTNQVKKG